MQLKTKKQVNGKNVAFVDMQEADIIELVYAMEADGWTFERLTANYSLKDGTKKKKEVPTNKVNAVQQKFNLDSWTFKATRNGKTIGGQVNNAKSLAAISISTGGALKEFVALPIGKNIQSAKTANVPSAKAQNPQSKHQQPAEPPLAKRRPQKKSAQSQPVPAQPATNSDDIFADFDTNTEEAANTSNKSSLKQQRANQAKQAANALYNDQDNEVSDITDVQRKARRAAGRKQDQQEIQQAQSKQKKHVLFIIFSILEIFTPAIMFGILALTDVIVGNRLVATDPVRAEGKFKEARALLILGAILGIGGGILCWNLPTLMH